VQEAIPEALAAKQALFADIEPAIRPDAILATNTSSLRLADVGARMRHPERLVGIHWVAPPYLVPVVEVVRGPGTTSDVAERAEEMLVGVGRIPVPVPDVAGFVLNRLQYALHLAAVDLVDQGIATPEQIDLLVRYAMAPRQLAFGAMRLFDLIVSARTVEAVAAYLHEETGDPRFRPSPSLGAMVESGRLGAASGEGWYSYPEADLEMIEARRDRAFAAAYRALASLDTELP
jgi:3-hydroxybutyryl-CoA dehydrogenase